MNFHPDFTITGTVVATSPRFASVKLRSIEDGRIHEQWYRLSYYAHPRLPRVGRRVEIRVGEREGTFINDWCYLDTPAAPYKLEPAAAGEDIPFEVSR